MPTGRQEYQYYPLWRGVGVGIYKKPFIFLNFTTFMDGYQLKILKINPKRAKYVKNNKKR